MENFVYSNPVKYLFGKGQLKNVCNEILPFGKKVLLVFGTKHFKETGLYSQIIQNFKQNSIEWKELEGVNSNPRVSLVRQGIEICKKNNIEFILAVGGGSVSDTAKAVGMGALCDYDIWEAYEDFHAIMHGQKIENAHVPQLCLPIGVVMTKPATGSDFDYTSVLSNHDTKEKLMVINKVMYPKFSIIDPELAFSLPMQEQLYGVADIMSHILEQYFSSTQHVEALDRIMEANLRTVIEAGRLVQQNQSDYAAQSSLFYIASWSCSDMSMCGTLGGWDSHMIEHEISAATDLNHGHGMAIIMLKWMRYMSNQFPEKFAQYAVNVWDIPAAGKTKLQLATEGVEKTAEYWRSLGITLVLAELGITTEQLSLFAKQAVRFGSLGVLLTLHEQDVLQILQIGE